MIDEFEKLTSETLAAFVERPCVRCGTKRYVLPVRNAVVRCDECAISAASAERKRDAVRDFEEALPEAYRWARLNAPELAQRVRPASAIGASMFTEAAGAWQVFTGPSGSGKTSLAVALIRERMHAVGEPWVMLLAFRMANARIQHRAGDGEAAIIETAIRSPFVLLDDIGQETQTANNPIADIIQARDADRRVTWITTGLSPADFGNRYGGGVARRVFERSRLVKLGGKS